MLLLKLTVKQLPTCAALLDLLVFLAFPGFPALETLQLPLAHCCLVMLSGPSAAVLGPHVPFQIAQADRKQKPSTFLLQEWMFAGVK